MRLLFDGMKRAMPLWEPLDIPPTSDEADRQAALSAEILDSFPVGEYLRKVSEQVKAVFARRRQKPDLCIEAWDLLKPTDVPPACSARYSYRIADVIEAMNFKRTMNQTSLTWTLFPFLPPLNASKKEQLPSQALYTLSQVALAITKGTLGRSALSFDLLPVAGRADSDEEQQTRVPDAIKELFGPSLTPMKPHTSTPSAVKFKFAEFINFTGREHTRNGIKSQRMLIETRNRCTRASFDAVSRKQLMNEPASSKNKLVGQGSEKLSSSVQRRLVNCVKDFGLRAQRHSGDADFHSGRQSSRRRSPRIAVEAEKAGSPPWNDSLLNQVEVWSDRRSPNKKAAVDIRFSDICGSKIGSQPMKCAEEPPVGTPLKAFIPPGERATPARNFATQMSKNRCVSKRSAIVQLPGCLLVPNDLMFHKFSTKESIVIDDASCIGFAALISPKAKSFLILRDNAIPLRRIINYLFSYSCRSKTIVFCIESLSSLQSFNEALIFVYAFQNFQNAGSQRRVCVEGWASLEETAGYLCLEAQGAARLRRNLGANFPKMANLWRLYAPLDGLIDLIIGKDTERLTIELFLHALCGSVMSVE